jgi:hypothetical protein
VSHSFWKKMATTLLPFRPGVASGCLSFSSRFEHKPGQCEPLFVPAGICGMVSGKVPGPAGCSHLGGGGGVPEELVVG